MSEEDKGLSSENEGGSSEEDVELSDDEIARVPLLGDDSAPNELPNEKLKELIDKQKAKNEPPPPETANDPSKPTETNQNAVSNTNNTENQPKEANSELNPDNNQNNEENKQEEEVDEDECFPVDAPMRHHHINDDILNQISENDLLKIADRQLSLLDLDYQQCINCQKRNDNLEERELEKQDESLVEGNPYSENYTPIAQTNSDDDDDDDTEGETDNLFEHDPNYIRKPHKPLESETNSKIKDIINTLPPPKYPKWVENLNMDKMKKMAEQKQEPPPPPDSIPATNIPPAPTTNQSNLNDYDILPTNPGTKSNKNGKKKRKNKKKSHKK